MSRILVKDAAAGACSAVVAATDRLFLVNSFLEFPSLFQLVANGAHELLHVFRTRLATITERSVVCNTYGIHVCSPHALEAFMTLFDLELCAPIGRVLSLAAGLASSPTPRFDASGHDGCGIHILSGVARSW